MRDVGWSCGAAEMVFVCLTPQALFEGDDKPVTIATNTKNKLKNRFANICVCTYTATLTQSHSHSHCMVQPVSE